VGFSVKMHYLVPGVFSANLNIVFHGDCFGKDRRVQHDYMDNCTSDEHNCEYLSNF
jgi:hypothetical protein